MKKNAIVFDHDAPNNVDAVNKACGAMSNATATDCFEEDGRITYPWDDDKDYKLEYEDEKSADEEQEAMQREIDGVLARISAFGADDCVPGMRKIDEMVGLDDFKSYLRQLYQRTMFSQLRRSMGLKDNAENRYHMILTGNPGTGKTTAARAIGRMLRSAGVLSHGMVLVRDRKSLVGEFIGETEQKMEKLLEEARGNVLFIDEAYNLFVKDSGKDFGRQIMDALLTVTSEANSDVVVILAGYEEEMDRLMEMNPGLASRFPLKFNFKDFTSDELLSIANQMLAKGDYLMTWAAEDVFVQMIDDAKRQQKRDFGNARWVHNVIDGYVLHCMAERVVKALNQGAKPTVQLLKMIEKEDVVAARQMMLSKQAKAETKKLRRIGFAA